MAGLAPANIRQLPPSDSAIPQDDLIIDMDEGQDAPAYDDDGAMLRIEHGDGSVTVSLNGRPLAEANDNRNEAWFADLTDRIDQHEQSRIADDLLRAIDDDITSRKEWIEARATGLQLLGLKIEVPGLQGASDGAPVEGMSKVRHPLLLESVLRFQANARSELLPTDGPIKVRDDSTGTSPDMDNLADALETDLNHYLTTVASEYYPDTDRMLLMLGFGGTAFKKVYRCPLRNRPVSETIDADDLIVNNSATDLRNAKRITHRISMRPSVVRRMQILGAYRDISLSTPNQENLDSVQREKQAQQGVSSQTNNPDDRDRDIYECYCELDIKDFEHRYKGTPSGLEVPYRVTIDISSRQLLSVVRNYAEDTKEMPEPRQTFVKYTFVPGLGFLDIGLLHILGNTTNAVTAAWREMLDNGMYANFPGFLYAKGGSRQNTNIFRVPPGGGAQIDTQGMPIGQAVMALPYNTQQMAPLMALVQDMAETGARIGGTSEQQVGEGRADAPVGTTLAMIEQATKVLNAVHKRMHASQAEEFRLLVDCFREDPESFWRHKCASKTKWDEELFVRALNNCELTPQADPNTASHAQRVMKIMALKQLQAANPSMYDPIAIDTAALQAIGWNNPQQFFAPPQSSQQPPPEVQAMIAAAKVAQQEADAKSKEADAKMTEAQAKTAMVQVKGEEVKAKGLAAAQGSSQQVDTPVDQMQAQAKMMDARTNQAETALKGQDLALTQQGEAADRASREHIALMNIAKEILLHTPEARAGAPQVQSIEREAGITP